MFPYLLKVKEDKHADCDSQYLCKGPNTRAVLRTLNNNIWGNFNFLSWMGPRRMDAASAFSPRVDTSSVRRTCASRNCLSPVGRRGQGWVPSSLGNQVEAAYP